MSYEEEFINWWLDKYPYCSPLIHPSAPTAKEAYLAACACMEEKVKKGEWWKQHGQALRNANVEMCDFLNIGCSDKDLIDAPKKLIERVKKGEEERERLREAIEKAINALVVWDEVRCEKILTEALKALE